MEFGEEDNLNYEIKNKKRKKKKANINLYQT